MSLQWYDLAAAVQQKTKSISPTQRWGHSGCSLKDPYIILFGGYSDSKYFNDTWIFNWSTLEWIDTHRQDNTECPQPRSNCTMVYDDKKQRVILFGGGSASNIRHNDIWIMDLAEFYQTEKKLAEKQRNKKSLNKKISHSIKPIWRLQSKSNNQEMISDILWPRTYHAGILIENYLFIQGGQGYGSDLDDLWCFNLNTKKWKEVHTTNTPKARRFHTGVRVDNYLYIIGGCYDGYNCLNDIHRINLQRFIKIEKEISLLDETFSSLANDEENYKYAWQCVNVIDQSIFLPRWGHMSCVIDSNIYIYGGRSFSDHQDVLLLQTKTDRLNSNPTSYKSATLNSLSSNPEFGTQNHQFEKKSSKTEYQIRPITEPMRITKLKCLATPKGRRRACLWVVGSCMILHGGFNGNYFDDMNFLNVHQTIPLAFQKMEIKESLIFPDIQSEQYSPAQKHKKTFFQNQSLQFSSAPPNQQFPFDAKVQTIDRKTICFRTKDIARAFSSEEARQEIYGNLGQLSFKKAMQYVKIIQTGVFDELKHHAFGSIKKQDLSRMGVIYGGCILSAAQRRFVSNAIQEDVLLTTNDPLKTPKVSRSEIDRLFDVTQNDKFNNVILVCQESQQNMRKKNSKLIFKANSHTLSMRSEYFEHFFKAFISYQQNEYKKSQRFFLNTPQNPSVQLLLSYKLIFIYLFYGHMVFPHCCTLQQLLECYELAEMYLIQGARRIILQEIMNKISSTGEVIENIKRDMFFRNALDIDNQKEVFDENEIKNDYMGKIIKFCLQGADWGNLYKVLEMAVGKIVLDSAKDKLYQKFTKKQLNDQQAKKDKKMDKSSKEEKENKEKNRFSLANISSVFCMAKKSSIKAIAQSNSKQDERSQKKPPLKIKRTPNSLKSLNLGRNLSQTSQPSFKSLKQNEMPSKLKKHLSQKEETSFAPKNAYFNPYQFQTNAPSQSDIKFELQLEDIMNTLDELQAKYQKQAYCFDKNRQFSNGMGTLGQIVDRVKQMYKLEVSYWRNTQNC